MKELTTGKRVLFLTLMGTLTQLLGFGYRVLLSRMVGAQVMGLYQLIMPVYSVLLSLTAVGLTAAMSNLTPKFLALGRPETVSQLRKTALFWLILLMIPVSGVIILWSDPISVYLLGGFPVLFSALQGLTCRRRCCRSPRSSRRSNPYPGTSPSSSPSICGRRCRYRSRGSSAHS